MEDCLVYLHAPHHQTSNGREQKWVSQEMVWIPFPTTNRIERKIRESIDCSKNKREVWSL